MTTGGLRALAVAGVVAVCVLLAVVSGELALGAAGPVLAPFAGVGLAAAVLAAVGLAGPDRATLRSSDVGRSVVLAASGDVGSLPALAGVLREGTRAAHADVWLADGDGLVGQAGERVGDLATLLARPDVDHAHPVLDHAVLDHAGGAPELRAVLTIGKPGRPVTAADRALVADVSEATGLLVRGLARGEELRARVARVAELARETEESRRRLGRAREAERRRLAAELADVTTDRFAALRRAVDDAAEVIDDGLAPDADDDDRAEAADLARHHLDVARVRLEDLLDRFRVIARGVHPAVLRDQGLRAALEEVVADLPRPVRLVGRLPGRLPREVESGLYHAAVATLAAVPGDAPLEVTLGLAGGRATVEVTLPPRSGGGTDPAVPADEADRLAALGGAVDVDTGGLRLWLPVELSPEAQ